MQDLHEETFKTLSKNTTKTWTNEHYYILYKRVQYHKDISSFYFNLKFNVMRPVKIPTVFFVSLFLLDELTIKFLWQNKQEYPQNKISKKEKQRGNTSHSR